MPKIRLGVNIDHVATVRNARGENYPDPLRAALQAEKCGAESVTIHLREDRRHINELDLKRIITKLRIPLNLEIAATKEMLKIALKRKPPFICIVPEKRKEITTEGGLDLIKNRTIIQNIIKKFKLLDIRTSLFINPSLKDIRISKAINVDCIEIHTGKLSNLVKTGKNFQKELKRIKECSYLANDLGIEVHAGHGLDYKTTKILTSIKEIEEFNIGHFIIGESVFLGLNDVVKKFKTIIK